MAQFSFPFDAGAGAAVLEAAWQKMSRAFLRTGVITGRLNQLLVTADGSAMSVSVATGQAQVEGFTYENDSALAQTIATANATNPRIDTVVVRLDRTANSVVLAVVTGTAAAVPLQPALSATDTLFEMALADVRVNAAVGTIAAGMVTDRRPFARNVGAAQTGLRNRLHNGDFRINQRGYVSGGAGIGLYSFDRWRTSPLTFTAAPQGQLVTLTLTAGPLQTIERANMPAGRYVLSQRGTATSAVYNLGGTGTFQAAPYIVDLNGLADVVVEFSGAGLTVGEVQLEQISATGTVADATPFERRPLGMELALCQRFFQRITGAGAQSSLSDFGTGIAATQVYAPVNHAVTMRALPTVSGGTLNVTDVVAAAVAVTVLGSNAGFGTTNRTMLVLTTAGGITVNRPYICTASAANQFIDLSADL